MTPINFGNRLNPMAYGHSSNSALTTSFLRAEALPAYTSYANATDDRSYHPADNGNGLPTIDTHQYSGPASPYGSPHGGDESRMSGLALSPVSAIKGLSVLDAPLPASFDSNGISHAARYGPWPASVPNKFGLESPSPSLHNAKDSRTSETLKMLHTSAFGSSEHLSPSHLGGDAETVGSSPPQQPIGEEFFGGARRMMMHSASAKYAKPRMLSASAPKVDRDWDDNFLFLEEDYVPGELANDLLTPAEKARRGSLRVSSDGTEVPGTTGSGGGGGGESGAPKFGSPSRWNTLFERQSSEQQQHQGPPPHGGSSSSSALGKSLKGAGAFGHVGSPLRNSSLASGMDLVGQNGFSSRPSLAGSRTGSVGAGTGMGMGTESLSALTQQLQRTRLHEDGTTSLGTSPHLQPSSAAASRDARLERHVSSGSIGSRFTTPIDEEDPSFVFSMEEDEEATLRDRGGRKSGGGGGGFAGWSYASIAGKSGRGGGGSKENAAVETR